jgi:hypothetical protein
MPGVTIPSRPSRFNLNLLCRARLHALTLRQFERKSNSTMYLSRSILLLIIYNLAAASAGGIRRRQLQGERIDYVGGATDLRGGSRVDPENANLLELAALRKVVLDGKCSDVCDVDSNPDWVCADENSHLVCHKGKTKCIPAVSFHKHCLNHDDTCGPCADAEESECGTCEGQGECGVEEVEICHKKRTMCVGIESWLGHCYNHGDTCGACPSIIEEDEGDEDGDGGDDADEDEGDDSGELDVSACAAPCSQEDSPALQLCAEEAPSMFPICHKGRNTLCVGPNAWPGHCLRHSDTCGPCSVTEEDQLESGNNGNGPSENSNAGGNGNGGSGNGDENPDDGDPDDESTTGSGSGNGQPDNSNAGGFGTGTSNGSGKGNGGSGNGDDNPDDGDLDDESTTGGGNGNGPPANSNAGGFGTGNGNGGSGNGDENPDDGDLDDESTTGGGSGNTR